MAMNLSALRAEMVSRGAPSDNTRNDYRINLAYQEIANAYDWPFTVAEATGTSGAGEVTVSDLRKVIVVGDVSASGAAPGRRLKYIRFEELAEDLEEENASKTGKPDFWWHDEANNKIKTYPVGGTIYVRYRKRVAPLTQVTDTPVFNDQYHILIVDRAMVEVYKDTDDWAAASAAMQFFEAQLLDMARDYEVVKREPSYIHVVDPYDG